jgi:hypothetical protein
MPMPEDPQADPIHGLGLVLDEGAERVAVTGANGIDEGEIVHALIVP